MSSGLPLKLTTECYVRASIAIRVVTGRAAREVGPSAQSSGRLVQAHNSAAKPRSLQRSGRCFWRASDGMEGSISVQPVAVPSLHLQAQKRVREILASSSWDQCWKEGVTPWDVGGVTPIIQHLVDQGQVPSGRALVPGCGSGYDVLALASESRQVFGLDISETVHLRAKGNAAQDPMGKWVQFILHDFFTYKPESPFSFIFDYTFFCALDPQLRPRWAEKMAELLSADGELLTLMFPVDQFEGGPPFAVSVEAYEEVLNPLGLAMVSCHENEFSLPARKGREKVARWKRASSKF